MEEGREGAEGLNEPLDSALSHLSVDPFYMLLGFPGGSVVKNLPVMREMQVQPLGREDPLEKEMATTHSRIPAWEIPWREERGMFATVRGVAKESDTT